MDQPLGMAIGNAIEVDEAIETLRGGGPEDLRELCVCLCAGALCTARGLTMEQSRAKALEVLQNGRAFEVFRRMVAAQGGSLEWVDHPEKREKASVCLEVKAPRDGWIVHMDTAAVGVASMVAGAGRETKESAIDPLAGILLCKKTGNHARAGETIARIYAADAAKAQAGAEKLLGAIRWGDHPAPTIPLILDHITIEDL